MQHGIWVVQAELPRMDAIEFSTLCDWVLAEMERRAAEQEAKLAKAAWPDGPGKYNPNAAAVAKRMEW